jgi:hypothetical protein
MYSNDAGRLEMVVILAAPYAYHHHHTHNKQNCTTLYSLTFTPQKKFVVLSHPNAHEVQKINKSKDGSQI